jgi:hypothetical protein
MRLAAVPLSTWALGGVAAAGIVVSATVFVPSVLFPPHPDGFGAPVLAMRLQPKLGNIARYRPVFEQPLFNPGRARDPVAPSPTAAPSTPALSEFRLVGIVTSSSAKFALVEQRTTHQVLTLHPGDAFAGRQVKDIVEAGVDLTGPLGAERLTVPKADTTSHAPSPRIEPKLTHP